MATIIYVWFFVGSVVNRQDGSEMQHAGMRFDFIRF